MRMYVHIFEELQANRYGWDRHKRIVRQCKPAESCQCPGPLILRQIPHALSECAVLLTCKIKTEKKMHSFLSHPTSKSFDTLCTYIYYNRHTRVCMHMGMVQKGTLFSTKTKHRNGDLDIHARTKD